MGLPASRSGSGAVKAGLSAPPHSPHEAAPAHESASATKNLPLTRAGARRLFDRVLGIGQSGREDLRRGDV